MGHLVVEYGLDVAHVGAQPCMQMLLLVLLCEDKVKHVGSLGTETHYQA